MHVTSPLAVEEKNRSAAALQKEVSHTGKKERKMNVNDRWIVDSLQRCGWRVVMGTGHACMLQRLMRGGWCQWLC